MAYKTQILVLFINPIFYIDYSYCRLGQNCQMPAKETTSGVWRSRIIYGVDAFLVAEPTLPKHVNG